MNKSKEMTQTEKKEASAPAETVPMHELLEKWREGAISRSDERIEQSVQRESAQLEQDRQAAQEKFRAQAADIAAEERQAMDNAALYAQLRGDRGGIGREQYSSIANTAAQNRLAVQQAQLKLSNDTARRMEELRIQGDFEKADRAMEITQNYLEKLVELEQWADEHELNRDEFEAQMERWQKEYELELSKTETAWEQWEKEFGLSREEFEAALEQWEQEFGLSEEKFEAALEQWLQEFAYEKERDQQKDPL